MDENKDLFLDLEDFSALMSPAEMLVNLVIYCNLINIETTFMIYRVWVLLILNSAQINGMCLWNFVGIE